MEKYCINCGGKIEEGEKFCKNCGTMVEEVKIDMTNNINDDNLTNNANNDNLTNNINNCNNKETNGTAIASFVCSLVGMFFFHFVLGIVALSLGITAKKHFDVFKNEGGRGLATAGIVIGIIDIVIGIMSAVFMVLTILVNMI